MSEIGINSVGVYVPQLRLERRVIADAHSWAFSLAAEAKGEKAFCDWDEDALTMAVDAVRGMTAPRDLKSFDRLVLASTSLPFAEPSNAGMAAAALDMPAGVGVLDATGSTRAGTSALLHALRSAAGSTLVVASEDRKAKPASVQEMRYGSAAVALGLGTGDVVARFLGGLSVTRPIVDRFRLTGREHDYTWEERWVREEGFLTIMADAMAQLMEQKGIDAERVRFLLVTSLIANVGKALAKQLGLGNVQFVEEAQQSCGHAGAAAPFLQLALALEKATPGDVILVSELSYGCDVLALEVTEGVSRVQQAAPASTALARRRSETAYLKYLTFTGAIEPDWGMRSEFDPKTSLTQAYRSSEQLTAFIAGKCPSCGTVQFPVLASCVSCASNAEMTPHPLADEPAVMATFTADWLSYTISPPIHLGLVQFESGARVFMEIADLPSKEILPVGTPVRMVFRRKDQDMMRGYIRYFWKAVPDHIADRG